MSAAAIRSAGRRPRAPRAARAAFLIALAGPALGGCDEQAELTLPAEPDLEGLYGANVPVVLTGNVVDVRARQNPDQLRRGGELWAKVGPYIYLFSPQTKELFETYSGIGGVRVRTYDYRDRVVAEALLERGALNSLTWPKALNLVARARLEGTSRPSYMIDLVEYGEDVARFEYSSRYVPPQ
jgi:hypothetical protein